MEQVTEHVIGSVLEALKSVNPRTSFNCHVETSQGIGYQFVFADKLPSTIFTDSKIEAEMCGPIKIELVDTISKAIVTSGPLSSMKIKIVVLDGDLGFEDQENWTEQDFTAKVVEGKKTQRPLVIGDLDIALRDGIGIFNDLKFTDNSSWIKCRKFRLSARVVTSFSGQVRIKEAISNGFKVKESRAKVYQKHYPPSLDDEVWRLKKIAKDGEYHKWLVDQHIYKVKDLMQILNCTDRLWNIIIEHASTCVGYDEKPNAADGHNYLPPAKCGCIQKPLNTYENVGGQRAILFQSNDLTSLQVEPTSTPTIGFSGKMHMDSYHASTSSSYKGGVEDHNQQLQLPMCGDDNLRLDGLQATYNEQTVSSLASDMTSQASMSTCPPDSALYEHSNGFHLPSTSDY